LEAWVSDLKPDIVGITESWTGSHILDAELTLEGYDLFRQDRPVDRCGGGVLLYIRNSLHAVQCSLVSQFPEQVWCYFMDSKGCRFHVGVCYRSPTLNIYGSGNHDLLRDTINELGITRKHFVLMGDCNYRYLHWPPLLDDHSISAEATEFYHCLEDNFFTQHVEFCTREDAILDLVISDEPNVVSNMTDLGPFSSSDHNAVTWNLEIRTKQEVFSKQILDYTKADIPAIKRELNKIDWHGLLHKLSAEDSWKAFKDKLEVLEHRFIPAKTLRAKRKKPIWMTHKAMKAVKHKRQVYRKYKDATHPAYSQAAKKAKSLTKKARREFERKLAKNIKEDRKSFFAYARNKSKSKVSVGSLADSQGEMISESRAKAEMLNDFFSTVFTKEDTTDTPVLNPLCESKLEDIEVDVEVIRSKLSNVKEDKAAGDDNMSPRILKAICDDIALPVTMIFRKSIDTGCVPLDWRTANVTPLFKKGSKHHVNNYRPVSLTSQICKVVESVVRDELVQHLDKHNLIYGTQHGFRKGYSCTTNLLVFLESVTASIDAKHNVDTIYLDLAKAFDKVPHHRLMSKLKAHGIDGLVGNWIKAWLSDRWQRVCLDGSYSSWRRVWSGVPQGSVLGPILFLIFINDIDNTIHSSVLKFADDTKVYGIVDNQSDGQQLQDDLNALGDWAIKWQMKFNVDKCKVVHYGRDSIGYKYSLYGQQLEEATSEKDLGIVFSNDLKVRKQCEDAYSKASQILGLIHRIIQYKDPTVLVSLYKSMVRPHLENCSVVWSPHYAKDKALLERVQHRFTRMFTELKSLPYEKRLNKLGLWSLEERRNRADLIEIYKMIKGLSSVQWSHFFVRVVNSITRGHNWKLLKKGSRCDTRLYFFSQRAVNRWNSLSQTEVDAPSINSFKNYLQRRRERQMDFFMD